MAGPSWGADSEADETVIAANVRTILSRIVAEAISRPEPTLALAHSWHREIHEGVRSVPGPHYLGEVRGSAHPDLVDYEVVLLDPVTGRVVSQAVPAADVATELSAFAAALRTVVGRIDEGIGAGAPPPDAASLLAVVGLAAVVHGEWIRIHPYANGNGRTARTWANWIGTRYGLPPFVRIKPRPDGLLYGQASRRSMGLPPTFQGDHSLTVQVFLDLLRKVP